MRRINGSSGVALGRVCEVSYAEVVHENKAELQQSKLPRRDQSEAMI